MNEFVLYDKLEDLDDESVYLAHKAREATAHSYAPYSKFHVGAALMLEDDVVVPGANQENAAYPLCMCAERVALYAAALLHPGKRMTKMVVVAHKKNHKELVPATCCGACRQVLAEYEMRQGSPIEIIMMGAGEKWIKSKSSNDLLPFGFDMPVS